MAKAYTDEKVASGGGSGGGVCLPVVEIANWPTITAEESAKLTTNIGIPIILTANTDGAKVSDVCAYSFADGAHIYMLSQTFGASILLSEDGVNWVTE
jgi:hypothetical protein